MVVVVLLLLWRICPPTVVNGPVKLTPAVRWMMIVTESDVMVPELLSRMTSSLYQGLLALIAGVTVTPPVPPLTSFIVRLSDVVRVRPPPVPVMVMFAAPKVAALEAVKVKVLLAPVVEVGLKLAVTPFGNPLDRKSVV